MVTGCDALLGCGLCDRSKPLQLISVHAQPQTPYQSRILNPSTSQSQHQPTIVAKLPPRTPPACHHRPCVEDIRNIMLHTLQPPPHTAHSTALKTLSAPRQTCCGPLPCTLRLTCAALPLDPRTD